LAHYGGEGNLDRSGGCAAHFRSHLDHLTHADNLAQIAFDEMNFVIRHRFNGDLDMHQIAGPMRPHPVRNKIAFGEGLQHARQQAGRTLGIEQKTHMGGHKSKLQVTKGEITGKPRLLRQPGG
jgi:hypothetical protein